MEWHEEESLRDIWNPWHGCKRVSEGCRNCYMYFLDAQRNRDGSRIYRTQNGRDYPIHKDRKGAYKVKSGEMIRVCLSSDFFLEEADPWREEAWTIMKMRSDVKFFLLTKRPERIEACLPHDWKCGWENIFLNISCENQRRAEERIPILLSLPFRHKGIMTAPLLGEIDLDPYLATGQIEQVIAGGENYGGARPCHFDWIKRLRASCQSHAISFCFIETGTFFVKDGKTFHLPSKRLQSEMAYKSSMSWSGKPMAFHLTDGLGRALDDAELYSPTFLQECQKCGSKPICNGSSSRGKCE